MVLSKKYTVEFSSETDLNFRRYIEVKNPDFMNNRMSDENKPEITRRFVANRESQQGTGNLAGLEFGQDKWKYPYQAAVEHPGEFVRRTEGGYGFNQATADSVYGAPNKDKWSDGPVQYVMRAVFGEEGIGRGTGAGTRYTAMPTQEDFRKNSPPLVYLFYSKF